MWWTSGLICALAHLHKNTWWDANWTRVLLGNAWSTPRGFSIHSRVDSCSAGPWSQCHSKFLWGQRTTSEFRGSNLLWNVSKVPLYMINTQLDFVFHSKIFVYMGSNIKALLPSRVLHPGRLGQLIPWLLLMNPIVGNQVLAPSLLGSSSQCDILKTKFQKC